MKVKCFQLSIAGVRNQNEDYIAFWQPKEFQALQAVGSIAVLADGVSGELNGAIASRLAADTALTVFRETKPNTPVTDLIRQIFDNAAATIFQAAQQSGRMSTTLLVTVFRDD
ncbi:MAG: PP2C family protein-serine/threonine phosphatase, partial [Roseiarcus sp.]